MSRDIYSALSSLDPVLRHPSRFSIMTLLILSGPQTEGDIVKKLGIAWGPLTTHLKKLEESGYVEIRRFPTVKGPRTYVFVTEKGVKAYYDHLSKLDDVIQKLRKLSLNTK